MYFLAVLTAIVAFINPILRAEQLMQDDGVVRRERGKEQEKEKGEKRSLK